MPARAAAATTAATAKRPSRGWLVAALIVLAVLLVLDVVTDHVAVLVGLFAAPPLIAALGATVRETAGVGVLAVVLAAGVTLVLRDPLEAQDAIRVLTVVVVSVLAVWIAELRIRAARLAGANTRLLGEAQGARDRLAEAFARLDVIFERAPVGLAFFDRELRYARVNERLAQIDGLPAADHLGKTVGEVLPAVPAEAAHQPLAHVLATGEPIVEEEFSGEIPALPGEERQWIVSYWPVRDGGNQVVGVGSVVFDVTERLATQRSLRSLTERYETLLLALSEVGEGMLVLEGERVVYANAAFEAMSGYDLEALEAMPSVFALVAPEERELAVERALGPDRRARGPHVEVSLRHRQGHHVRLEVAGVPLHLEEREQLVIVLRDISARKAAESEREELLAAERRARAHSEAAQRRAAFLAGASSALDRSLDVDRTVESAARAAVGDYAETCVVVLGSSPATARHVAAVARTPEAEAALASLEARRPLETRREDPLLEVLRSRAPMVLPEDRAAAAAAARATAVADPEAGALLRRLGTRASIVVPLQARGRLLGAMALGFDSLPPESVGGMRSLYVEVARRAGLAVDNARLYEERTAVARTLQRSLLPPALPSLPGMELAARYVAAGEGNEVGGDFYDCFDLGGGEWALTIGDVCGKGAEAAAITALARYTIRASVLHSRAPRDVLSELNEVLLRQGLDYRFCSVLYAGITPGEGHADLRLGTGGHPLPFILRADGRVEEAGRPGTLLGIVATPELSEETCVLEPGDALVLYTDGVIEASPTDDAFGPEAFAGFLAGCAGEDAVAIARRIEEAVLAIQDGRPRDDVAVVVLRAAMEAPVAFDAAVAGVAAAT